MKFQCPACQVNFSVPDEKIPEGKTFKILCPKCRLPIESKDVLQGPQEYTKNQPMSYAAQDAAYADDMSLIDVVEEGTRTALICLPDKSLFEAAERVLLELGFFVVIAEKASFALSKLRNNRYDVIMLGEKFETSPGEENMVLRHLQLLPMHTRREFFLCLISNTLPTLDHMLAFRLGVDMILNVKDMEKTKILLARSLKEYHKFYKSFRDELAKRGQL